MKPIIFATNNAHKLEEIRAMAGGERTIISLKDAGMDIDIPEPWPTFRQNALHKCDTIYRLTGLDCFSEDSGLETDALNGEPGVKSARYAGEPSDATANIKLLLRRLAGEANRAARFRTVICHLRNGVAHYFEGVCEGSIALHELGNKGFGYDPVFIPQHYEQTFAEMDSHLKNQISHRKKAFDKLILFLAANS
jgi:XTP/dITP diphosphohydrolase